MTPYLPLGVGGVVAVAALVLMLAPTECFVMQNYMNQPSFPDVPYVPQPQYFRLDQDGNLLFSKKVFSSLEESEVIVVDDPPDSVLDALLFWAGEGGITVSDSDVPYRLYHVECNDPVSRGVQQTFPSMFPNSVYESDAHAP